MDRKKNHSISWQQKSTSLLRSIFHTAQWTLPRPGKRMASGRGLPPKINLSRSYIQHLYKYFFGCSLIADLSASQIEHAKYLLSSTKMTVSSISGYENDVDFMRMFKKRAGITPTQFRGCITVSSDELKKTRAHPPFSFHEKKDRNEINRFCLLKG